MSVSDTFALCSGPKYAAPAGGLGPWPGKSGSRAASASSVRGALKTPPQGSVGGLRAPFRAGAPNVEVAILARVVDPVRKSI
jgi:hypothetical protein